jgi:hypothetical protein
MISCSFPRYPLTLLALLSVACGYDNSGRANADTSVVEPVSGSIDTGATMTDIESGVGVFVEYTTGGTWKLQVGCDTATSDLECNWDIWAYTREGGRFISSEALNLERSDWLAVYSDGQLELQAITRTDLDGVIFKADPGDPVTFDLWLDGEKYPEDYFYYVSEGAVQLGASSPIIELTPTVE